MLHEDEVKIEEFTEDGELAVRAEMPVSTPKRTLSSRSSPDLCIRAEGRHEEKVEQRDYRREDIRYGSFSRVLPLPARAKESDIKARYKERGP